jgi:hypothetical protein
VWKAKGLQNIVALLLSGWYINDAGTAVGSYAYSSSVQHGIIAATADQASMPWDWHTPVGLCSPVPGTNGALGRGANNSQLIYFALGMGGGRYATRLAIDYSNAGFNDWYLPSTTELQMLYSNKAAVGGFDSTKYYQTSTEYNKGNNYVVYFANGAGYPAVKTTSFTVRPVRAF